MYLETFGLKMYPFANTADPRFFFANEAHEEALANMTYAIEQGKGMVVITGQVGTGKTLLANVLSLRLRRSTVMVTVPDPLVRGEQLMRSVHEALVGSTPRRLDRVHVRQVLVDRLIALQRMGQRVAVLVDEAQDLCKGALEQIRLMSNWENHAEKLIQWVLIGQPELRQTLGKPQWEHFRQRIALSYDLRRLAAEHVGAYLAHRLTVAAGGLEPRVSFEPGAAACIAGASDGAPRVINNIADAALLAAYADGATAVTEELARAVARDMTSCGWANQPEDTDKSYRISAMAAG